MYLSKQMLLGARNCGKYSGLTAFFWIFLTAGCAPPRDGRLFRAFSEDFAARYFDLFPDESPLQRDNPRLAQVFIPTLENMDSAASFYRHYSSGLEEFPAASLSEGQMKDFQKIKSILNGVEALTAERATNPSLFNIYRSMSRILRTPYASLPVRLKTISEKLALGPSFYEAAKKQASRPDRAKAGQAIRAHIETYLFLDKELRDSLAFFPGPDPVFLKRIDNAKLAVKDYIGFCESAKLN